MLIRSFCVLLLLACTTSAAFAQSLGTFRWQLQPFCNVLTLTVTQNSGVYTLDGFDDQCGAATVAPLTGTAIPNPNGTIELGVNIVASPGGAPVHVAVPLSIATLGGTWYDSLGNTGSFVFNPGAPAGAPRPAVPPPNQFPAGLVVGQTSLFSDGGILARGTEAAGPTPLSKSTRLLWNPAKGAFRVGGIFYGTEDDDIGLFSTAMGLASSASGRASIALGNSASARGDSSVAIGPALADAERALAIGFFAVASGKNSIAIGEEVRATAANSVALGSSARSLHSGSFVYGDCCGSIVESSASNQFTVGASGGSRFFSNILNTSGVTLAPGASAWASVSDVNMKENFRDLDGNDVLAKIARMPIREWNYKAQEAAIRHVGPTAQDFHAAFGLGEDPLRISTIDADGIALAGVKALALENRALKIELASVRERLERLERRQP